MVKDQATGRLYLYRTVLPVEVMSADGETLQVPDRCCVLTRRPLADDAFQLLRLFGSGISEFSEGEYADNLPSEVLAEVKGKRK